MQGLMLALCYTAMLVVGLAVAAGIGLVTDQINAPISMLVFFGVATLVTTFAWPLAVRLTEPAA